MNDLLKFLGVLIGVGLISGWFVWAADTSPGGSEAWAAKTVGEANYAKYRAANPNATAADLSAKRESFMANALQLYRQEITKNIKDDLLAIAIGSTPPHHDALMKKAKSLNSKPGKANAEPKTLASVKGPSAAGRSAPSGASARNRESGPVNAGAAERVSFTRGKKAVSDDEEEDMVIVNGIAQPRKPASAQSPAGGASTGAKPSSAAPNGNAGSAELVHF